MSKDISSQDFKELTRREQTIEFRKVDIIGFKAEIRYLRAESNFCDSYTNSRIEELEYEIEQTAIIVDELVRDLERFKRSLQSGEEE